MRMWNQNFVEIDGRQASVFTDSQTKDDKDKPVLLVVGLATHYHDKLPEEFYEKFRVAFFDDSWTMSRSSEEKKFTKLELDYPNITIDKLVENIEKVRKSLGEENLVLFGHSLYGLEALACANKYPEKYSAIMVGTPLGFDAKKIEHDQEVYFELNFGIFLRRKLKEFLNSEVNFSSIDQSSAKILHDFCQLEDLIQYEIQDENGEKKSVRKVIYDIEIKEAKIVYHLENNALFETSFGEQEISVLEKVSKCHDIDQELKETLARYLAYYQNKNVPKNNFVEFYRHLGPLIWKTPKMYSGPGYASTADQIWEPWVLTIRNDNHQLQKEIVFDVNMEMINHAMVGLFSGNFMEILKNTKARVFYSLGLWDSRVSPSSFFSENMKEEMLPSGVELHFNEAAHWPMYSGDADPQFAGNVIDWIKRSCDSLPVPSL